MACIVNAPSSVDIIYGRSVSHAEPKLKELPFLPPVIDRLAVAAADLRRFLARVHFAHETVPGLLPGALYQPTEAFNLALARYEKVWMPLLASFKSSPGDGAEKMRLAAPLDVQWMHHLHRLDPDAYRADCDRGFGQIVDPADPFLVAGDGLPAEDSNAETAARAAWRDAAPAWPFDLEDALRDYGQRRGFLPDNRTSSFDSSSCNMVGSATNQGGFLWQVLPEQYGDAAFVRRACERYAMLVALWRDCPGEFLVPTYDMDLVWHAHLSTPRLYAAELLGITGRAIDHDDSVNDRTPGAKLDVRGARTRELWKRKYGNGESYVRKGAMWRGDPPDWYWTCTFGNPIAFRAPGPVVESWDADSKLHATAAEGHVNAVRDLRRAVYNVYYGLVGAASRGHVEVVKVLLEAKNVDVNKAAVNRANRDFETPLCCAASRGHGEVVRVLLEAKNVDVNTAEKRRLDVYILGQKKSRKTAAPRCCLPLRMDR